MGLSLVIWKRSRDACLLHVWREGREDSSKGARDKVRKEKEEERENRELTLPAGLRCAKRHFTACAGRVI